MPAPQPWPFPGTRPEPYATDAARVGPGSRLTHASMNTGSEGILGTRAT